MPQVPIIIGAGVLCQDGWSGSASGGSPPMTGVSGGGPGRRAVATMLLAFMAVAIGAAVGPPVTESHATLRLDTQNAADELPELWIDDARIPEADSGSQSCMFTLHLSAPAADTVTVNVATFDSTAT